jgi:hypothetical protein
MQLNFFFWAIIAEARGLRPASGISQLHWTLHHSLMQLSRFMLIMLVIWLGLLWVYHVSYIVAINERSAAKFYESFLKFQLFSLEGLLSVNIFMLHTTYLMSYWHILFLIKLD